MTAKTDFDVAVTREVFVEISGVTPLVAAVVALDAGCGADKGGVG